MNRKEHYKHINAEIQKVMSYGESVKNFYRFTAQNPHIELRNACQIIVNRPTALISFSFEEWNAMGRKIVKGSKGVKYYDSNGNKRYVFSEVDTHGDAKYLSLMTPAKKMLEGLKTLTGKEITAISNDEYRKILVGVTIYLAQNKFLNEDVYKNDLLCEGVAYSLYCKTDAPQDNNIKIRGLPYSLQDNAQIFKDIYAISNTLNQEIEKAYLQAQQTKNAVKETAAADKQFNIVTINSAVNSNYKGYVAFVKYLDPHNPYSAEEIYLGKSENYDNHGNYDNSDNSLILLSKNPKMYSFLYSEGWTISQQEMIDKGYFTEQDYAEFNQLKNGILKQFECKRGIKFGMDINVPDSGISFSYPNWQKAEQQETPAPKAQEPEKPKPTVTPYYKKYLNEQEKYPDAVVVMRIGDFYEIMGDNAVKFSNLLDLTLTGRGVGLSDRVPMCGFPFHTKDKYIEKITASLDVVIIEDKKENVFMKSAKQAEIDKEQHFSDKNKEHSSNDEQEFEDFSDEDYEEFVSEFADEIDDELSGTEQVSNDGQDFENKNDKDNTFAVDEENESDEDGQDFDYEDEEEDFEDFSDEDEQDFDEEYDEAEGQDEVKQLQEKKEKERKSIHDRYDKKKVTQPNFFDLFNEPKEQTPQEKLIERQLQRGSGFEKGKFRIYEQYFADPTVKEYSDFLKHEYGIGGYGDGIEGQEHNGKGLSMRQRDRENPENDIIVKLNWKQVARKIADLIDDNKYLTEQERLDYEQWKVQKEGKLSVILPLSEEPLPPKIVQTDTTAAVNTDLNELEIDQSELGGAKARFKGNVEAIRLVNKLFEQDRNPTHEEKKILAKYVGWGGIQQAFDEHNEQWQKEYSELKSLLSAEDYDRARGSTLNAHYTSKEVIEGIYEALDRFGVKGNNKILEPALGTGNFYGYMPQSIADNAKLYGVELDNITGRIAQKLYPNVNVQIKGFEETSFPNNHFDVVVSNVPFGSYAVYDTEYSKYNFHIHDYFIAKGIDKLKPNGIMAVITSKFTMDKLNPTVRKHIADRAEFLGAIRLPNTAFKQTAGTEVTADILFFQKREENISANDEWIYTGHYNIKPDVKSLPNGYLMKSVSINSYFADHPEMMLGTLAQEHGMYNALDITLNPDGRNLSDALSEAISRLPENIYKNPEYSTEAEQEEIAVDYDLKPLCFKAENNRLYMRVGETMVEQPIPKIPQNAYERIAAMIDLRAGLRRVLDIQSEGCSDEVLAEEQRKLNAKYDRFVRYYGFINSQTNIKLFRDDGDSALLFASENISEDKTTAEKSDIFTKRTIRPYSQITHTDDCFEALQISKNEKGKVDIAFIEELTKKDYDTVLSELDTAIFRNPLGVTEDKYSGFETAEEYLSGEVVKKLRIADQFVRLEKKPEFERNVKALTEVQPAPVKASEISARLGASWIDKELYHQFICELLKVFPYYRDGVQLFYNPHDSSWRVDRSDYIRSHTHMNATEIYGTQRASAFRLFEDCLNLKDTQIYDTVEENGKTKRVLNHNETVTAREKQNKIKEEFKDWIFKDPERRDELEIKYNSLFNQIRLPSYDGSYLKFPQMNPEYVLDDHQKDAVHRTIVSGNTLVDHPMGGGKTFTLCATAMKLRQYGLAKKIMIVVPNHLVEQWGIEFRKLYPKANLFITSKDDLEKENRKRFVSKVAMGDWDAVIIAQSSFAKIPISEKRQTDKIVEEITSIEETIDNLWNEGNPPRGAVKNLERIKKNKEAFLKKLMDGDKKDNVLTFESLGVDYLFIDEAHYYKNLFLYTKMNNVAGISNAASQRASDLKLKCEYINDLHNADQGVAFATGTPLSNSMTEMYTMQTYLQKRTLQNLGITYFDAWAANFGETITSLEMTPSGQGYRPKTRFAKFTNLPELLTLFRSFADVKTSDMLKLNVPEVERKVIILKPSDTVLELAEQIVERAEKISCGNVKPTEDNMLKVTSDGKKLALDARCFDRFAADEPTSKLNECANRVFEVWETTQTITGTQLVFCDLSTPKKAFEDYEYGRDFDVYNDLKYKLVQKGIPQNEIAFIHDANSDTQKQNLFNNVNDGKVRILIGSTEKCGAGTNVQKRLVALHHLDTPYRPSDLQQREGRIIRQGNTNEKVQIYTYVTERTFDSYSYQILENKQRFIAQIDRGDLTVREAADIDETTLSYAEIKAITAANPKIKRKMEVDTEIARLRILEGQYNKNLYSLQDKIRKDYPEQIRKQNLYLERTREDIKTVKQNYNPEVFSINVLGITYTDKKEGGKVLIDALMSNKTDTVVAEFCGFKLSLDPLVLLTDERSITVKGAGEYTLNIGASASGTLTRLDNFFEDFPTREKRIEQKLLQLNQDLETAKEQVTKPFEHQQQLTKLLSEQTQINAELDLNRREEIIIDDIEDSEENEIDEPHKELPQTQKEVRTRRRAISPGLHKAYKEQQAKAPDAYIFTLNGNRYELIGEQAKQLADDYGLSLSTQELNKESLSIVSLETDQMDKIIAKLVDKGKQIRVIEPMLKEEEKIINNEEKTSIDDVAKDGLMIKSQVVGWADWSTTTLPDNVREAAEWLILNGYENESDVKSAFYYRQTSDMSDDRDAVENDNAAIVRVAEKYRQNTTEQDNENQNKETEKEKTITVLIRRAGQEPTVEVIENTLEAKQEIVDGYLEMPYNPEFSEGLQVVCNEEGKFVSDPKPNAYWGDADVLCGDILFVGIGDEGETISLTPKQIDEAKKWIAENDASGLENFDVDDIAAARVKVYSNFNIDKEIETMLDGMTDEEARDLLGIYFKEEKMTETETKQRIPLYKHSFEYAGEHGELEQFGASLDENRACRNEITQAINDNFKNNVLGADFEKPLIEKFGLERMAYVLANTVQYYDSDGRFSRENKDWAKSITIFDDEKVKDSFIIGSHNAITDLFVDRMREIFKENETAKTESKQYIPIYTQSAAYAQEHDEIDEYRASRKENRTCKEEIEKAINENYDDNRLKKGFETALIEKFGFERMSYVLANTLQNKEWDGRFKGENKEWARTIPVYEDKENRSNFVVDTHSVLTDTFVSRFREALKQPQEKKEETEEKKTETAKEKKVWLKANVARDALIKKYDQTSFMRMPSNSEYADYTYNMFNHRVKESKQIVDNQSDTRELSYELIIAESENIRLTNRNKETVTLTGKELAAIVGGTTSKDYATKKTDETQWFSISIPQEAMLGMYDEAALFQMPNKANTAGFNFYVPNRLVNILDASDTGRITIRLPEDFEVTARNKDKDETLKLTSFQLFEYCNDTGANEYLVKKSTESDNRSSAWTYFGMNTGAKIAEYENRTLFKMPKGGEYENFVYYIPNKLIKEDDEKGTMQFSLPNDLILKLTDNKNGEKVDLSVEQFLAEVKDKTDADYNSNFHKPSEGKSEQYLKREEDIVVNCPDIMKQRENWCIVRTKENSETGRLDKYIIDCHTGKHARSDDPTTWTNFVSACNYAKANGGETLAYCLDGKDKICCIDLDKCIDKGGYSDLAISLMSKSKGTYMEHSLSGKGVHIFGTTDGLDIRTFAKEGDLEFYQKSHFIAITGDVINDSKGLVNLDNTEVKTILEQKCTKRTEWKGIAQGVEGLSSMSDRDVVEKAITSKGGETFKALYNGQDLQNNHSNSDMSLMNRLAFWCNADKEQMLRIFATSGLFRKEKSPDYYESTAIKAIRDTTSRYQPQAENNKKPPENKKPSGNGSGGNGKA